LRVRFAPGNANWKARFRRFSRNDISYRLIPVLSLFLFIWVSSAVPVSAQDFTINKFQADLTISDDSSLMVKETLEVLFHQSRHGIYREIPFKYTDERGNTIITPLDVLSVTDGSGNTLKYKTAKKGNAVNIRIGDPHAYVEGTRIYIITYQVENAILFFDDHDELYWNVTGNYWWAPIREASANVTLAVKKRSENLWAACYMGAMGSTSSACGYETSQNSGEFFTKRNLGPREGFTIAFGWNKGLVSPPSSWKKFLWALNMRENWIFILPVFSFIFMINRWNRRGRDPKVKEAVTVMYEPPQYDGKPLTPGEVGTLIDEKLDPRDITSTIVGLSVKGYMKIEEHKDKGLIFDSTDYYLAKVKEPDDNLGPFEKILMNDIFPKELQLPGRMVSEMKNEFYKHLTVLKSTLYGELVSKKYFLVSPDKVRQVYMASGIALVVFSIIALTWLTSSPKGLIAGFLTGLPVIAFAKVMPAKTKAGASAYMDILGFQEFMTRAEKDKLERMGDKGLFSKFLPYAIALDVVDIWAKAFEGIYQDAPDWYVSHTGFTTFSPYHFSRSINSATSTLASTMYSAPRSSGVSGGGGFSGGGSSGGGFGGGGGGSW
jgi:uncharacterized membrane protein